VRNNPSTLAIPPDELEAALAARRELGGERESEVVEAFVARVGRSIDRRVDERLADQGGRRSVSRPEKDRQFAMAIVSLIACIPLTAIALGAGGLAALLIVWAGIVLLNVAFARMR